MHAKQRQRIIDKHRDSLTRYGYHPHALYWSSREVQEIRFQILLEAGIHSGAHILDVGCGFGDFRTWANQQGIALHYTGIDLSPDILREAQMRHPDATFYTGDIFDMPESTPSFDWVILSGALNEELHDASAYAKRVIRRMYQLARQGVAFNLLDARRVQAHDLHSQYPDTMLEYCQSICPHCVCRDDYLDNDFSMYMYRNPTIREASKGRN